MAHLIWISRNFSKESGKASMGPDASGAPSSALQGTRTLLVRAPGEASLLNDATTRRFKGVNGSRIIKFGAVGCVGIATNMAILYVLFRRLGLPLAASSAVAVEFAVITNYSLNEHWTFATRAFSVWRLAKFNIASLVGLCLNVTAVWLLARLGIYFLLANLVGITAGFGTNYSLSVAWVWGKILWHETSYTLYWYWCRSL